MGVEATLVGLDLSYFRPFRVEVGDTRISVDCDGVELRELDAERRSSCLGETKRRNRAREVGLQP